MLRLVGLVKWGTHIRPIYFRISIPQKLKKSTEFPEVGASLELVLVSICFVNLSQFRMDYIDHLLHYYSPEKQYDNAISPCLNDDHILDAKPIFSKIVKYTA